MAEKTKGKCKYCGKEYTKAYMLRHLKTCKKREELSAAEKKTPSEGFFTLEITDRYENDHWLIIEIKENADLHKLDNFLRDIWLECCGHLSAFTINGITYEDNTGNDFFDDYFDWGPPSESTNIKLKKILNVGMSFKYEYNFGSTTELIIKVKDYRRGGRRKEPLIILSRNNPIEYTCHKCGKKPAEFICTECLYGGEDECLLCKDCAEKHTEHEWCLLPVCNSPRMGVCAYEGSSVYPDQFEPDAKQ